MLSSPGEPKSQGEGQSHPSISSGLQHPGQCPGPGVGSALQTQDSIVFTKQPFGGRDTAQRHKYLAAEHKVLSLIPETKKQNKNLSFSVGILLTLLFIVMSFL